MSQVFEQQLNQIREQLLMMASLVERNLQLAFKSLVERDSSKADQVEIEDNEIDALEVQIDEMIVTYMATHGAIAKDCRFLVVSSKIVSNLERMGDQAVTIARRAKDLNLESQLKPLIDVPRMGSLGIEMLKEAVSAFIEKDPEKAQLVIARDKSVDDLNRQLTRELTTYMIEDPKNITRCLNLLFVSRSIERMADHAKNIAEEVFYLYRAKDIRHQNSLTTPN
jgi:phosphate transport system protein